MLALFTAALITAAWPVLAAEGDGLSAPLLIQVTADWEEQEKSLGRPSHSVEAIKAAAERAQRLFEDLVAGGALGDLAAESATLASLREQVYQAESLDVPQRVELYRRLRTFTRELALRNPLVSGQRIAFMMRRRAVGYMLYEYLGWYYAHGNDPTSGYGNPQFPTPEPGGGVYVLEQPGRSMAVRDLTAGQFPPGHFVTLALSYDAETLYFAYADPTGEDPYESPGFAPSDGRADGRYNTFHLYALPVNGAGLRQLTVGPYDDFDPTPLPDGGMAFMSTRRGGKLRCGGGSPEMVFTLHRMEVDGSDVRTLSFHETNEWHPSVLPDGRIIYTRWDYVDRNAAKFHGLWTCHLDGTQPSALFGNYTTRPWACYQAKGVPDSSRILFVAGGHHANVGGALMLLDPARIALDTVTGEDCFGALEQLTPSVCLAEADGWPTHFFHSPWPLSENYYLVAFSHDPLPGGYTGTHQDSETGIYYFDRFGNLELLFRQPGISAVYPIPLAPRPIPPRRATVSDDILGDYGELLVQDVTESLLPMPAERPVAELRVFQLLPKSRTDRADDPRIGHPEQSNARMLLGTVPVEPDGSAHFRAPARVPLYFQAVDKTGRAVQGMRSIVYLQPGERRSCVGCHEPPGTLLAPVETLAALRPPSEITPGPPGTRPFGFARLVQPILDQYCVACHDGSSGEAPQTLNLTGSRQGMFTASYESLQPYLRWPSYDEVSRPGGMGADISPLSQILNSPNHRQQADVPEAALRAIYLWLDAHVPFYGTYEQEHLSLQRQGLDIPPPSLQ